MTCCYDLGDCWDHDITIVGTAPASNSITCLDGEGHGITEDAGSIPGWLEALVAYRVERPNNEQRQNISWFEVQATNADPEGLKNGGDCR